MISKFFICFILILPSFSFGKYENIESYSDHKNQLKYKDVSGYKLAYIDEGEGPVIVLMHGIPTNSWMYRKIIPILVKSGFRVIAPDLLGLGASDRPSDRSELSVPNQAKLILALLKDKLKIPSWIHVVHDFAGPITWEMMELEGFQIKELIVLNTFAFEEGWHPGLNFFSKGLMKLATTKPLKKIFYENAIKSMLENPGNFSKHEFAIISDGYITPLLEGGSETHKALYFSVNKLKDELPRYQKNLEKFSNIPSKIIWGKHDKFLSSKEQLTQIKNSLKTGDENILILNEAKHLITEEDPDKIVNFITSNKIPSICTFKTSYSALSKLMNEIQQEFFPDLDSLKITAKEFNSDAYFLQTRIDVKTLFKAKIKRKYFVEINPKMYDCAPSPAALKAILVHELEHINDYNEMSSAKISKLGVKYASSKKFRTEYERATDEKVLVKGLAQGLIEYRLWIYSKLSPRELELKKLYYFTPEEISIWVKEH